jgi:hypothetical protein
VQPVLQQTAQARIVDLQQVQERLQARHFHRRRHRGRRCVQRQLGRRRIAEEGLGPFDVRHLQRRGALAQHRFQRRFPARFDIQFLPQARQRSSSCFAAMA